jgi:hypothetical protein
MHVIILVVLPLLNVHSWLASDKHRILHFRLFSLILLLLET